MSQPPLMHRVAWPLATGILFLGLASCGDKQQEARSELTAKAFTFTVDEYIRAAREGNVTALRHFLEAGMAVDVTDGEGATALFRAAQAGRSEAVAYLAGRGASTAVTGTGFDTPLVAAARVGSVESVRALLAAKADPAVRTMKNWTALTAAAYRGEVDLVRVLAPLSSESLDEALQIACLQGKPEVVDVLLASGADVFSRSKENKTPLMYAAANGHQDVVRLLMLNGSNKLLIDNEKQTAADLAVAAGHPEVVHLLNDPRLVAMKPVAAEAGAAEDATAGSGAAAVEGELAGGPAGEVAGGATGGLEGELAGVDGGLEMGLAEAGAAPPFSEDGEVAGGLAPAKAGQEMKAGQAVVAGGHGEVLPGQAAAEMVESPVPVRLQGARLAGLSDGSTAALKETVRVRDFREDQLPIVLEEVPVMGESARIRVLGRGGNAPEIVPAGGVIGDTGLELVRAERKFMNSKMGEGHQLDISHAVVRDRATGRRHIVKKDQTARSSATTALISAGAGGEVYEVQEGDEFTAGDERSARYRVLDVRPTQVIVENLDSGETATLARGYAR